MRCVRRFFARGRKESFSEVEESLSKVEEILSKVEDLLLDLAATIVDREAVTVEGARSHVAFAATEIPSDEKPGFLAARGARTGEPHVARDERLHDLGCRHRKRDDRDLERHERAVRRGDRRGKGGVARGELAVTVPGIDGFLFALVFRDVALQAKCSAPVLTRGKCAATVVAVDEYDIDDLVRLSGYSARGIRHYITKGLLPRPKLAGTATRYSRETLGRLSAIRVWREKDKIAVTRIKRLLRELTDEEVDDWADALDPREGKIGPPATTIEPMATGDVLVSAERWMRVPLAPGLDLVLREDASEAVRRRAAEIQTKYGAGRGLM